MRKTTDRPSLIDFWRLRRRYAGLPCEIRPFHEEIADKLTQVMLGKLATPNLMILMPPRCAKTDLGCRTFVPWAQSHFVDSESIIASYGLSLARESAVDIKTTLSSPWYRSMVDTDWGAIVTMRGSKADGTQDYFRTQHGGTVKAVGIEGGTLGFGAGKLREEYGGCILMDDLLKAQESRSQVVKQAAINAYEGALKSRRNRKETPRTPMILIMQRLAPDDPAGYILANERDEWTVLQIPAHNDECTETIWPGRLGLDELMAMREARPEEYWAQYMQEPSESSSTIFKRTWWKYWHDIESVEKRITGKIVTADTAFQAKESANYSVLQCWGFEGTNGAYLLDQIKGRWEFPELLENTRAFFAKHSNPVLGWMTPASSLWIENKASGQSLVQTMRREGIPARPWEPDEKIAQATDKVARANQCTMPISTGRVYLPNTKLSGYKWVDAFVNECFAFSGDMSHAHDDQVDTMTMALLIWLQMGGGRGAIPIPFDEAA